MKVARILSLADGPQRDVEVKITSLALVSSISDPPGLIKGDEVAGLEIAEAYTGETYAYPDYSFRIFIRRSDGGRVLFYHGATRFDLALLLDEFEAALPNVPRSIVSARSALAE